MMTARVNKMNASRGDTNKKNWQPVKKVNLIDSHISKSMRSSLFQINEDEAQIDTGNDNMDGPKVIDSEDYLRKLAPLTTESDENDFSTCSLQKDNGRPNLSAEYLANSCKGDWRQMCMRILQKQPIIDFAQFWRVFTNAFKTKKNLQGQLLNQVLQFLFDDHGRRADVLMSKSSESCLTYVHPTTN